VPRLSGSSARNAVRMWQRWCRGIQKELHLIRSRSRGPGQQSPWCDGKGAPGRLHLYVDGTLAGNTEAPGADVSTRPTGDVSITCLEVKIQLAADSARFVLTLHTAPGTSGAATSPKPATTPGTREWRWEESSLQTAVPPYGISLSHSLRITGHRRTWPIRHDGGRTRAHGELDVTYPAR